MPKLLKNRAFQVALGVLVAALIVVGAVLALRPTGPAQVATTPADRPVATTGPAEARTPDGSSPTAAAGQETCTNFTGPMESPTQFVIERMQVDSPMMVVGKDKDGNPGAPPPNEAYTTAWYNGSPEPGTTQGNVILTIHTYSKGQALGNDLYGKNGLKDGTGGLREGDLIKVSDAQGNQVCYRYTGSTKVWVDTYDPTSGVFHNPDGPPQLAIMICWDFVPATGDWDSRIIFYAELIPEGQPV
ncbi:class F sortase [Granulicoccus sp. GXG6511]|uniref:class F sortase n=1 Tax=Granulicoccus sp. GXG6511 TaxID=3381351 RepID=UPI003D7C7252